MRKIITSLILLIVSGCASTMESLKMANTQNLLIQTPHVNGAECELSDKGGRKWRLWETPGTIAVKQGHPPLVIICTKKGFKKSVLTINEQKEELLTIDGKRIDVSLFNQFPTKFPRLIPGTIRETAGFMQDPTGSVSTEYPNEVIVWMEPKKWESEEQMREWAFDREVQDRAEFINEEDAKLNEERRKAKRRVDSKAREEKMDSFIDKTKEALNPIPPIKKGLKNTTRILNPMPAIEGAGKALNPIPALREVEKVADPGTVVDYLNEQNRERAKVQESRELEKLKNKDKNKAAEQEKQNAPYRMYMKDEDSGNIKQ